MKSLLCFGLVLVLAGCGEKSSGPGPSTNSSSAVESGTSVATAPADYLKAVTKSQQTAVKTVDTASIAKAIELFNVDQGRFPKDLNELVEKKFMPQIPQPPHGMKLAYDALTGTVKIVPE
jgi:hypothetical protein